MACEEPELVVFLQENDYQIFKEICIDKETEVTIHDKCCVEDCELDHSVLSVFLNSEVEVDNNYSTDAPEVVSFVSNVSQSFTQRECIMEVTNEYHSEMVSMESNVRVKYAEVGSSRNVEAQRSVWFDSFLHRGEKDNNKVHDNTKSSASTFPSSSISLHSTSSGYDSELEEDSCNGKRMNCESFKSTVSCIEESTEQEFDTIEDKAKAEDENTENAAKSFHDTSNSSFRSQQDILAPHSGSSSMRSNSSSNSTRSFAFPILPSEWYDSPIRMAEADGKNSRKRRQWRTRFICCNF